MNNLPNKQEFSIINPKIESWHEFVLQVHQVTEWDASVVGEWPYRPNLSRGPWCQSRELLRSIEPAGKLNITFEISSLNFFCFRRQVWAFLWHSPRVCVTFVNTSCSLEASCFPTRAIRGSWQREEDRPMHGQTQSIQTSGRDSLSLFLLLQFVHPVLKAGFLLTFSKKLKPEKTLRFFRRKLNEPVAIVVTWISRLILFSALLL